nr:nucleotide-binding alpha-beta plait domain-containing protein [Tanacetum cinerariifolium]
MGSFRSKEDDVSRISILIFITNFMDSFFAKDLFHSCKQYGHVVDSFIPTKRTKDGKRFGFVRFINVFNVERLVNNLCTIWVGRLKLHANVARFKREFMKGCGNADKMENVLNKSKPNGPHKEVGKSVIGKSFMSVVKDSKLAKETGSSPAIVLEDDCLNARGLVKDSKLAKETESSPAIVLEDDCLNARGLSLSLMGRVKELAFLANLKKALCNEGFNGGELLDVDDYDKTNFHSKRFCILTKVCENIYESFKIVFRGKVYWVRASEVPGWTPEFFEEDEEDNVSVEGNNDGKPNVHEVKNNNEESDMEEVLETVFDEPDEQKDNQSKDPFGFYPLLNKENSKMARKVTEGDHILSHPPGFTPNADLNEGNVVGGHATKVYEENERGDNLFVNLEVGKDNSDSFNKNSESTCSGRFKESEMPRTGGSILSLMEDVVKVGQTIRYNMDGCIKDITVIIESQGEFGAKEKRMLWDYLSYVSNQWDGKIVMMGDFNEVRYKSDRFGSNFNTHDAEIFNSFIYNAGLEEVPLGGSAYTWCHKSATKMSKLDRFLVSENLLIMRLNITAITLERYISDHRPILLREAMFDYGPIPFLFYRYWLEVDGFNKLVRDSWSVAPVNKRNAIRNFICKLKFLKERIRSWKEDPERKITKKEVERTVWDCGVDKSPGPDGFSFNFYRHFWTTIEQDVFEAVDYFFMHGDMPNGCNSNFIALIPKILDANMVKEFHPISLIGSLYKIIAKILANRLVGVLDDLVNEVQSAFVADRQILDGPFILNEINYMVNLSHLFYVDDAIFLGQWSELNIDSLVQVLECFFGASGLRINMCKSKIMGDNVVDGKVKNAAVKLGCLVLKIPFTYFGTKVEDIMSKKHA